MKNILPDSREKAYLTALRQDFHQHPELGLQEFRTAGRIEEELDRAGIPHTRVGETGVLGTLRGTGTGAGVVVLRADMDALPIQETSEAEYRSRTPGVMHACGHDAHTACLLGAARLLAGCRGDFGGEVRFVFQPAEEIGKGARDFVEAGVLEGVDRVFGLHVAPELPVGTVGLKPGLNNAAVDHFRIAVRGASAHVATPQLGADALYIASHTVVALQALVTRLTSPVEPVIIGVGTLNAGTAYNAVAASAVLQGTTRTVSQESRQRVRRQIDRTARSIAEVYGGTAEVLWTGVTPPLINDPGACREAAAAAREAGLQVITDRSLSLCGDNFAEYLLRVPGAYAYLGSGNPALPNTEHSIHSADFDLDEEALALGAALSAAYARAVLSRGAV
ncbi:M20 metallopeptidase family protein [Dysosmobacter sp.]|uniref:M20 metallopeptidase family protein n=1 Tax=Dysosmobacter sp. TaxID=2591382 RepID=UPI002A87354B|nr:M20 family metallopeptidase [Dysosmobacter sp.]MDY3281124.1 M20 family metallopeptidase [Dysosmobacter sp.]